MLHYVGLGQVKTVLLNVVSIIFFGLGLVNTVSSLYQIVIAKMSLLCRYQIVITKLPLPDCHFYDIPKCHYQIVITTLSLPNCHYQIFIIKLSLPNYHYQIIITKIIITKLLLPIFLVVCSHYTNLKYLIETSL